MAIEPIGLGPWMWQVWKKRALNIQHSAIERLAKELQTVRVIFKGYQEKYRSKES
jgi:hypothetical protein